MSRIILTKFDDGEDHIVVGWDHPGRGCWWQEFNAATVQDETGEEVARFDGYMNGIPIAEFRERVPDDIRPLITDEVIELLVKHALDPNSGRQAPTDLSSR
jgi:hypothetical protein